MSDYEGYFVPLADFDYLGEDARVSGLQKRSIKGQLLSSSEAAWGAMSPKLRCGDDLMKLQLSGPEVANVELCRGNGVPVPLTQLPPHCGHTTPTYGGLVYATPYDGCGVAQQGGSYVMQIQWQGNSAVISCPMTSTTAKETFQGPHPPEYLHILLPPFSPGTQSPEALAMPQASDTTTLKPPPPGYPQGFWPFPHYLYPGRVYPIAKQTEKPVTTAQAPIEEHQPPQYHQMFWPNYYHPGYLHHGKPMPAEEPFPTSGSNTESDAQAPTKKPQPPQYHQMFWPNYYHPGYLHHGKPMPAEKPFPTSGSNTESDVQAPTEKPQPPQYHQMFWPNYYHPGYLHHGKPMPAEKPFPTSGSNTESDAQAPTEKPQPPQYHQMFWPNYYHPGYLHHGKPMPAEKPFPTSGSNTESDAQAPTERPQPPQYHQMFWPDYYPHDPLRPKPAPAIPTAPPPGLPATTQMLQPPVYPGSLFPQYNTYPDYPLYLQEFYPRHPVQPPKTPTAPPITTTPQPCTTTAAAECRPSANQPPNVPPQRHIPPSSVSYEKDPVALQFVDFLNPDSFP
ncbi:hypothetical protein G5714_001331 [Onychostoma macrolepis]|uniref:Uncharacterized protein n=2 Tax=Onychostoma macrolepis TaxID=369639 RepID=A0A7J6DBS2_9TELE|nr:hypothetical protein G5714_001331 [Onychostoma macrolepis]